MGPAADPIVVVGVQLCVHGIEALHYIRRFHNRTIAIQYGGNAMIDPRLVGVSAKSPDFCHLGNWILVPSQFLARSGRCLHSHWYVFDADRHPNSRDPRGFALPNTRKVVYGRCRAVLAALGRRPAALIDCYCGF
jgi:hypothetical protein